jgi:hypothetical protein
MPRILRRAPRDAVRAVPVALLAVLAAGVALRALLWASYSTAFLNLSDSAIYVSIAQGELFSHPVHTAGYPGFMRVLHAVSSQLEFTLLVQNLIGLATGVLLYATVRRAGGPTWAGVIAAAAVLLSLDNVFLEHALMTETLFTFLLTFATYAAVRGLQGGRAYLWIVAAGVALGLAVWVRSFVILLIPAYGLWLLLAIGGSMRARIGRAVLGGAAATVVVLVYCAANAHYTGYFGLSHAGGWALYSRVAPFADCNQFTPPAGTRRLCETTPPLQRPGPDFYGWENGSPARIAFGGPPNGGPELSAFARTAILHQPIAYLRTVASDSLRYVDPAWGVIRPYDGPGYEVIDIDRRAGPAEANNNRLMNLYYAPDTPHIRAGTRTLGDLQGLLRMQPLLILLALVLAGLGLVRGGRGAPRAAIALLLGGALLVMLIPPATAIWTARYAVPAAGWLAAAGALGAWALMARRREAQDVTVERPGSRSASADAPTLARAQ